MGLASTVMRFNVYLSSVLIVLAWKTTNLQLFYRYAKQRGEGGWETPT